MVQFWSPLVPLGAKLRVVPIVLFWCIGLRLWAVPLGWIKVYIVLFWCIGLRLWAVPPVNLVLLVQPLKPAERSSIVLLWYLRLTRPVLVPLGVSSGDDVVLFWC